ncbi:hypothetical protein COY93_04455 [Candidatus Uhrbacteria bacterium CG_4_10_14_0_8_um_filter_58_22]|uniref:Uncharacterized protein n=1 Tax=Candidatus Uhrbacteria bacterium CG_4_10_14_0_8_um_filter_58_22 TaxID=1975029 RepID=A0A2M7QA98_9BACT|nr:MAG: hypothetical protein AUJ19_02315 [Parcubacteria group bacterium CG1_02_58_44]PIY61966.1 MAG: hypothetical protein COY93_04455 [Candidatus Uhrbacteria bacterium CG_4_10_14_0_8_um_filter_58_22]
MESRKSESHQETGLEAGKAAGPVVAHEQLTPEQEEQARFWLEKIREGQLVEKSLEPAEKEKIASEIEVFFETWLVPEKLGPLLALETQAEALASPLRAEAKEDLAGILRRIILLGKLKEFMENYMTLSKAVGIINGGVVDHVR